MMETTIMYYNDSGFYSRSEFLGSHTEHNPICNSIKICTKIRIALDYNSLWDEAPSLKKYHAVALEFVSGAGRCNERSPTIFKIEVSIFQKKNSNNFHYDKRSKLDIKYRSLLY
jgi:hypothetical protein